MRALLGVALVLAALAGFVSMSLGLVGPRTPLPTSDGTPPAQDSQSTLLGSAVEAFSIVRLSGQDGAPVWSASGTRILREEGPSSLGYAIREPGVSVYRRGEPEPTRLLAPSGQFTSLASKEPVRGSLAGGVSVRGRGIALETDTLSIELPASNGMALEQLLRDKGAPRIRTESPVRATFAQDHPGKPASLIGLIAENGAEGRADLRRLELKGPVIVRDERCELMLDATDRVVITLARAPRLVLHRLGGAPSALGGSRLLMPELSDGLVIARLEASGQVVLRLRRAANARRPAIDLHVEGDRVDAFFRRGFLTVQGAPGLVAERVSGNSVRAPSILARDLGATISVDAWGGVEIGTRLRRSRRATVPRDWTIRGETAHAILAKRKKKKAAETDVPELVLLEALVSGSEAHRGHFESTPDAKFQGTFSVLTAEGDVDDNLTVHMDGGAVPIEAASAESDLVARILTFVRKVGEPDRLVLEGSVAAKLGHDVLAIAGEDARGKTSPLSKGGPWRASGERVELTLDPKPVESDRALAWFERSSLLEARLEGAPGAIEGKAPDGRAVSLLGAELALDLQTGKLSADAGAVGSAVAVIGSASLAAREIRGDLRSGKLDARGGVRGAFKLPAQESIELEAEEASATLEADEAKLKVLREQSDAERREGRPQKGVPPEVLAFSARGEGSRRARLTGPQGTLLEGDALDYEAATHRLTATRRDGSPRVHLRARETDAWARRLELEDLAAGVYQADLFTDVHVEGAPSGRDGRFTLDADRLRGLAHLRAPLGKTEVSFGPVVAWVESATPLVLAFSDGRSPDPVVARGRVLRAYPEARKATLTGRAQEPPLVSRGRDRVRAERIDMTLEDPGPRGVPQAAELVFTGEVQGSLDAKVTPFVFEAPRATAVVDLEGARAAGKTQGEPLAGKLADMLGLFRSLTTSGGVKARLRDQSMEADDLEYDARRRQAVLHGNPLHVKDRTGYEFTTRDWRVYLDEEARLSPGPP